MHAVELAHQPQPELAKQAPQVGRVSQESAATVEKRAIDAARSSRSMGIAAIDGKQQRPGEAEGAKSMGSVREGGGRQNQLPPANIPLTHQLTLSIHTFNRVVTGDQKGELKGRTDGLGVCYGLWGQPD